jgi:hypothetical protein
MKKDWMISELLRYLQSNCKSRLCRRRKCKAIIALYPNFYLTDVGAGHARLTAKRSVCHFTRTPWNSTSGIHGYPRTAMEQNSTVGSLSSIISSTIIPFSPHLFVLPVSRTEFLQYSNCSNDAEMPISAAVARQAIFVRVAFQFVGVTTTRKPSAAFPVNDRNQDSVCK